ncbi:MAG: response regulator transcription factor [Pseudomonadota bacterium]|uniref:LuxR family two component transcriptional regulator n=1 Tax=Gallaecimonas pentaromativorans TaxID=584787 RepID=A0A3N1NY61_9GAMM|nr:response regulator transcription factor [Gallaecimonas pentaromativorans]MED5523843.1 response regulator transcription factor [Pseudomonadota bacterium]ROQ24774.1 LuxR family two component transcriptional regulator [Gallaecimonas pentaromativorans]
MPAVHAIIADDHPLFRGALKQATETLLEGPVMEAASMDEVWELLKRHPSTELVFLDLMMPGTDGFAGLSILRAEYPDVVVIMISAHEDATTIGRAMALGASAFVPKSAPLPLLAEAIAAVRNGDTWLPEGIEVVSGDDTQHLSLLAKLTPQQLRVLKMIADGLLNKQIAYEMDVQETTIKQHVSAILRKLEVNNRTQAGLLYQSLQQVDHLKPATF